MSPEQASVVAEVLERAAVEMDTHELSKGDWARLADGTSCTPEDPNAAAVCAIAAVRRAYVAMPRSDLFGLPTQPRVEAVEALRRHIYGSDSILMGSISAWSDSQPDAAAVASALRECAATVRAV